MKMSDVINAYEAELRKKAGVVLVYEGHKRKGGENTKKPCIVVGVRKKVPKSYLARKDVIPQSLEGYETDVIESGGIKAFFDPTQKSRPAPPGSSLAWYGSTAGTFGCVVLKGDRKLILSNNHVLAGSGKASIGDAIYQPGPADGGNVQDQIAVLEDFIPIKFDTPGGDNGSNCWKANTWCKIGNFLAALRGSNKRVGVYEINKEGNEVDAAIAAPLNQNDVIADIPQIGIPKGVVDPELDLDVQKFGRTTSYTNDAIVGINAVVSVEYDDNQMATFRGPFVCGPMCQPGDSGSAVLDMHGNLVGLLFAGSAVTTICCPIKRVFELLNVEPYLENAG